jgi:hypothetical protein
MLSKIFHTNHANTCCPASIVFYIACITLRFTVLFQPTSFFQSVDKSDNYTPRIDAKRQ